METSRSLTNPDSATKSLLRMRIPRSRTTEALATAKPMALEYSFGVQFLLVLPSSFIRVSFCDRMMTHEVFSRA